MSLNVFANYIENCKKYGKEPSWEGLREYKTMYNTNAKEEKEHPYIRNKKIVNGIIDNEFDHIQEYSELDFTKTNIDYRQANLMTEIIHKALMKDMTEKQRDLLDEFYSSLIGEATELCRFYFREGLKSALTNLNFLKEIDDIEYIL